MLNGNSEHLKLCEPGRCLGNFESVLRLIRKQPVDADRNVLHVLFLQQSMKRSRKHSLQEPEPHNKQICWLCMTWNKAFRSPAALVQDGCGTATLKWTLTLLVSTISRSVALTFTARAKEPINDPNSPVPQVLLVPGHTAFVSKILFLSDSLKTSRCEL